MTWLMLSLRRNELQQSYSQHTYEKLQISRQLRRLSNFSAAVTDGVIDPSEIARMGTELFGDAIDVMYYAHMAADEAAQNQTDIYSTEYDGITQEQYYSGSSAASKAELYFDESGALDLDAIYSNLYDEALKDFAQQKILPMLKDKEEELEEQKTMLETLAEAENAEMQEIKNAMSQAIQEQTIKLS